MARHEEIFDGTGAYIRSARLIRVLAAFIICIFLIRTTSSAIGLSCLLAMMSAIFIEDRTYAKLSASSGDPVARRCMTGSSALSATIFAVPTVIIASGISVSAGYLASIYASAALIFQMTGYGRSRNLALAATLPHGIALVIAGAFLGAFYIMDGHPVQGTTILLIAPIYCLMIVQLYKELSNRDAGLRAAVEAATAQREEAEAQRVRAEDANIAKTNFLASMSHEIRTPMNGILGLSDMLSRMEAGDEVRNCSRIIQTSAEGLMVILNDVLDFSKLEAGRIELDPQPFCLRETIESVVALTSAKLDDSCVTIRGCVDSATPECLVGDEGRIRQILLNLAGNAAKFTHAGSITIAVQSFGPEFAGEPTGLRLSVADTGIGIAPDAIERVFERFSQASTGTTREYGGTGLGLSICRELAELMGGTIRAVSEVGRGSVFYFDVLLPVWKDEQQMPRRAAG